MYQKILVPLDGSKRAEAILRHVVELARPLNAGVLFLHIAEDLLILGYDEVIDMSAYQQQQKKQKKKVESYLAGMQKKFQEEGIEAQYLIAYGPVVRTILIVAEKNDVDLIALASRGLNGSFHAVCASVTAGLLESVSPPILLIRNERDE